MAVREQKNMTVRKLFSVKIRGVNYALCFSNYRKRWIDIWTPAWHKGRGPYITAGFYFVAFYRGY